MLLTGQDSGEMPPLTSNIVRESSFELLEVPVVQSVKRYSRCTVAVQPIKDVENNRPVDNW